MPITSLSSLPLRIAILGVGKIGSAFGFQLARTGNHDVTICRLKSRKPRCALLAERTTSRMSSRWPNDS